MDAPKFIASDIDGTFLNPEHRVVSRNRDVVTRAVQSGAQFALATGRPHRWIQPILDQIPLRPLCVTSNGAVVYDSDQDRILRAIEMESEAMDEIVSTVQEIMVRHGGASFAVERAGLSAQDPLDELYVVDEIYAEQGPYEGFGVAPVEGVVAQPAVKLIIRNPDLQSQELFDLINPHVDPELAHVTFSIPDGMLEVAAPGISKEVGVEFLASHYGIAQKDVIAFGDMPNDIEMLEWAGIGVAMDNAVQAVKDAADIVTVSNDEAGVAHVLERWF
ncbi:Cof-type HAD-IIB family hydrolase [Corynebacterium ammoniagenes]|uniref:Haloacid dehalogenase n=2 Tax=Corynebacterium ammoniagenes TaxID=1697 RepID=A0AAV5G9C1_CORAM|nr:Cof-type HAD-IIB family hydrolase [Corynebacterium ammoniagenes]APT83568.1 HAD family hydrolase [Corynebacterium ammoniagenes DSM 20306]AQS74563.1 HAD family hydrolase [Corynebacterium ammoniagenes]EFG81199.1 Cof-like hydrolase [Corynebacterium ammoniagenes DSM 20306]NMF32036.1 Cof-type HAD-IIB family hydrolase [Corynebacterium ammoniagenes]GJN43253.1 haloacid dehalogenase [Corynebacterium ammoniagenes]